MNIIKATFIILILACANHQALALPPIPTQSTHILILDVNTKRALHQKKPDDQIVPASMTKVMTLIMVLEALRDHRISLTERLHVSNNAWRKGGAPSGSSTMFLSPKSYVSVENLIRGLVVQSGNDAAIALAEGLAPSERAFAQSMTLHGRDIGLTNTVFRNATGLPTKGHFTTPRDLIRMALYTMDTFPQYYHYYAETEFTWNGITQKNRNPLLFQEDNKWFKADGLKTGYTKDAGYSLLASAQKDERRVIMLLAGLPSKRARAKEARQLLEWSFRAFKEYDFFKKGDVIDTAPIWHGTQKQLPLVAGEDIKVMLSRQERRRVQVKLTYEAPVKAPVEKGQKIGVMHVLAGTQVITEVPLLAKEDVQRAGIFKRALQTLEHNFFSQ